MVKINFDELKPPWIHKSEFYKLSFNYCDRWCEKCVLTSICRVYKNEQKARKQYQKAGKNPNSMDFTFKVVENSLQKTFKLIDKELKKLNIDPVELKKDLENEEQVFTEPTDYPLYNLATKISMQIDAYLDTLIEFVKKPGCKADKCGEILDYYKHLIPSKTFRAITSQIEEQKEGFEPWDSSVSAWIIVSSINKILAVLYYFVKNLEYRLILSQTKKLIHLLEDFKIVIEEKFLKNDYCEQRM